MPRPQTVSDFELGKYGMHVRTLVSFAELYGVSTDWLLGLAELPKVKGTGGIINLRVEQAVRNAGTFDEAIANARRLRAVIEPEPTNAAPLILFGMEIPSDFEVVPANEWKARREALALKLERLQNAQRKPGPRT